MTHVRYIDKTRQYYRDQGYEKPYEWAHFEAVPFTPLRKPLAECRLALVSTSDVAIKADDNCGGHAEDMLVANVYSIPTDLPVERLHSRQQHFDKYATHLDDVDSYFPITRLREAAADGRIGGVAVRAHGVYTAYSQRRTLEIDGPEVLKRCREDGVDAVILTPI